MESKKWVQINLPAQQQNSDKCRKQTYSLMGVRGGGTVGKLGLTYTHYCI